ncbi:MAG: class I SAM-dependent methyltransferase [Vicinamibacteria bacterium]
MGGVPRGLAREPRRGGGRLSLPTPPPPDVLYTERVHVPQVARPSWSANPGYLDEGHRTVWDETKDVPGWQLEGDAYKLYELARFAGDVILDLGAYGGRSAVVELKGALGRADRAFAPQVYSLDLDPAAIRRSLGTLQSFGLEQHVLLFQGPVDAFFQTHDVGPSLVFVDADHRYEGVRRDLDTLSAVLAPGVPVLCHDYLNRENDTGELGVRRAATEWEEAGVVRFAGAFGAAALFVTTDRCTGTIRRLPDDVFARRREAALITYGLAPPVGAAERALLGRLQEAEGELARLRTTKAGGLARRIDSWMTRVLAPRR